MVKDSGRQKSKQVEDTTPEGAVQERVLEICKPTRGPSIGSGAGKGRQGFKQGNTLRQESCSGAGPKRSKTAEPGDPNNTQLQSQKATDGTWC